MWLRFTYTETVVGQPGCFTSNNQISGTGFTWKKKEGDLRLILANRFTSLLYACGMHTIMIPSSTACAICWIYCLIMSGPPQIKINICANLPIALNLCADLRNSANMYLFLFWGNSSKMSALFVQIAQSSKGLGFQQFANSSNTFINK